MKEIEEEVSPLFKSIHPSLHSISSPLLGTRFKDHPPHCHPILFSCLLSTPLEIYSDLLSFKKNPYWGA